MMKQKPQKNVPVILIAEEATNRLEVLRGLIRRLYYLAPFESVFREFVLAFSTRKNIIWIWAVLRSAAPEALRAIREEAERFGVGWIDLLDLGEEEKERRRETVVKHQESYQVFSADDIDSLLDLFKERMALNETSHG